MVFTKREKIIVAVLGAAVALLVADRYAFTPYMRERDRVAQETLAVTKKLQDADRLFKNRRRVADAWQVQLASGLKTDPADARSQALHALDNFARSSRVEVQGFKTDEPIRTGDFLQLRIQTNGTGSTASLAAFLWRIENAPIPLRINDIRAAARKEGVDDLTFNLSVSTILFSPAPEKAVRKPAPKVETP